MKNVGMEGNSQRIIGYEPEDGVFMLDEEGLTCNVAFAFKLDDGRWVDLPDGALGPVLNLLGETSPGDCVGKVIALTAAPVIGAVQLRPGVCLVGLS